jgi:hypothetical protein
MKQRVVWTSARYASYDRTHVSESAYNSQYGMSDCHKACLNRYISRQCAYVLARMNACACMWMHCAVMTSHATCAASQVSEYLAFFEHNAKAFAADPSQVSILSIVVTVGHVFVETCKVMTNMHKGVLKACVELIHLL